MQNFFETLAKNASNPQAMVEQLTEANKKFTETLTKQINPAVLKSATEAPQKAIENLNKYNEINQAYAKKVQEVATKVPFDASALLKEIVDYQQSILQTNTAIVQSFFNEVTESAKAFAPKK